MADSSVQVRFSADIGQLVESIDKAKESLEGLGEGFRSLAELAGIGLSADAFKEWISASAEAGEQMVRMAAILGTSVPQVSELSAVAKLTGTDFQGLATAMERLQLRLTTAGRESSAVAQALKAMGINAQQFQALSIPQQMERLAEAAQKFADGAGKTAAFQALGRNFVELLPMLDRGKEGLDELREAAQASGAVMSTEVAESFARTKEDISALSLAATGFSNRLFSNVNPAVDATVKYLGRMLEAANPGALGSALNEFVADLARLTKSVAEFASDAIGWLDKLNSWGDKVANVLNAVNAASTNLANSIRGGVISAADSAVAGVTGTRAAIAGGGPSASGGAGLDRAKTLGDLFESDLASGAKDAADALKRLGGVSTDVTVHKPGVSSFQTGGGRAGREAVSAAMQGSQAEVDAAKEAAKQIETVLDGELKTHQITMATWLTQTKDALQDEADDVTDAYNRELTIAGLTSAQIIAIKRKEAAELASIAKQVTQAENKAAEQSAQQWQKFTSTIESAFDSQIGGLLRGTENFKQAFTNITAQLLEKFITFGANMVLNFALNMSGLRSAFEAFNSLIAPLSAAGTAGAAAASKPGILAQITADSGEMLAGFTAFFAPTLGPGALAAAQGLTGAATAQAIGLTSAAVGGYVLSSGLANIHAGETIVPAQLSQPYQGGAGGGSPTINISAIDSQSLMAALSNVSSPLAKLIAQTFNNNQSLRPAY